ncbi:hypothetical protein TrLO_g1216 [Triparma laevis f. longispina]|uniref:WW domain-containing protein n=1 Tax=Triparma laevis f. longispina TaxID=1714387 RepID=A0A9W7KZW6_9STRA|nr:hypothetical protein TrLO_g1216 [Triparma laevis f. longispina]
MPTWTKNARKFNKKFKVDTTKTDPRFVKKEDSEAKVKKPPAETYSSGFASWQLQSQKFRPPAPSPKHDLYREDIEYETWEEHFDDDGQRFFFNPMDGKSQWEIPRGIKNAMDKEERKRKKEVEEYYAAHGSDVSQAGYSSSYSEGVYEGDDGYFYDQEGNYIENYQPRQQQQQQLGYENEEGKYYAEGGYYDESGNWVGDESEYYDDGYDDGWTDSRPSTTNADLRQLTEGSHSILTSALDELGDDEDDEDDYDYDDGVEEEPEPVNPAEIEIEPTGDPIQDEIARTRKRLSMMKMKPLEGAKKKWGLLKGVKNVLTEVNEAGKLHDEDLVMEEEMVAVCSLLANKAIGLVVNSAVPKIALRIKKERLKVMEDKNHANWKVAHADFRTNKVEVVKEVKVGSAEYLEMHEHDDDEEEMKGGEWDDFEEARRKESNSASENAVEEEVQITSTDGRSLHKLISDLGAIGVDSKKLARVLFRLSHSKLGHAPLREVDLTDDPIGDLGASCLATLLKHASIVRLYLVNCNIGNSGAKAISQASLHNRSLMELYLNNNAVTDEGVRDICTALGSSPTLKTLNLSSNKITEDGAKYLAAMLVDPGCRLRNLFLSGALETTKQLDKNKDEEEEEEEEEQVFTRKKKKKIFGEMSAGTLAVLETKRKLARKKGRIGFMGVIYLSTALMAPHGCPLRSLTLVNCDIGPTIEGCKALSSALYANEALEVLNISENRIGDAGAELLVDALRVNKVVNNFISRNCGLTNVLLTRLREAMMDNSELNWLRRKDLAKVAVENRNWMLGIAQSNNFKYAASAYIKSKSEAQMQEEADAKVRAKDKEIEEKIEGTDSKWEKAGLKVVKGNLDKKREVGVAGGGDLGSPVTALVPKKDQPMLGSKSAPDLTSTSTATLPVNLATPMKKNLAKYDDFDSPTIEGLKRFSQEELNSSDTSDLLESCTILMRVSVREAKTCEVKIKKLKAVLEEAKAKMGGEEERHKQALKGYKSVISVHNKGRDRLKLLNTKLNKDLKPLHLQLLAADEPLTTSKLLLNDLISKKDKGIDFDKSYAKIDKAEEEVTMGEAILNAKLKRQVAEEAKLRGEGEVPVVKEEDEDKRIYVEPEHEILLAAKSRVEILVNAKNDLKTRYDAMKKRIGDLVREDEQHKSKIEKVKKSIEESTKKVLEVNGIYAEAYTKAANEMTRLQGKLRNCRVTAKMMKKRVAVLKVAAREKGRAEDYMGLVTESCSNDQVDEELRKAINDDRLATVDLERAEKLFKDVEGEYESLNATIVEKEKALRDMVKDLDDANRLLGNDLQHWERERNTVAGVGFINKWRLCKVKYDKLKGKKEKIEGQLYNNGVPEGLKVEFGFCEEEFRRLDEEKVAAEEIVKMSEPRKILWGKELGLAKKELERMGPVYWETKGVFEEKREDQILKRRIASELKMDHMALASAEQLRLNPPKSFSEKADKEKREALVNFAKDFNKNIMNPSKVIDYHYEMRLLADISRIRKEQLLLQVKDDEDLTKEQFLMKQLKAELGIDYDIEHGTVEWRTAINKLRRKKDLRHQKERSLARKAERNRRRRQVLVNEAENMPLGNIIKDLKAYGMPIEEISREDELVELWVMCKLRERIVELGNWGGGASSRRKLGKGVYKDPESPIKKKVLEMEGMWEGKKITKGLTFKEKMDIIKSDTAHRIFEEESSSEEDDSNVLVEEKSESEGTKEKARLKEESEKKERKELARKRKARLRGVTKRAVAVGRKTVVKKVTKKQTVLRKKTVMRKTGRKKTVVVRRAVGGEGVLLGEEKKEGLGRGTGLEADFEDVEEEVEEEEEVEVAGGEMEEVEVELEVEIEVEVDVDVDGNEIMDMVIEEGDEEDWESDEEGEGEGDEEVDWDEEKKIQEALEEERRLKKEEWRKKVMEAEALKVKELEEKKTKLQVEQDERAKKRKEDEERRARETKVMIMKEELERKEKEAKEREERLAEEERLRVEREKKKEARMLEEMAKLRVGGGAGEGEGGAGEKKKGEDVEVTPPPVKRSILNTKRQYKNAMKNISFLRNNVRNAARIEIRELLLLNPKEYSLMRRLGMLCIDLNAGVDGSTLRRRAAMILLERCITSSEFKNDGLTHRKLAEVHFDIWTGEGSKAAAVHLSRAKYCWDQALRHLDIAADPTAWESAANVYIHTGDYKSAGDTLQSLIKSFPKYKRIGRVKLHCASLYMSLGEHEKARDMLMGAMARGGDEAGGGGFGEEDMVFFMAVLLQRWGDAGDAGGEGKKEDCWKEYKTVLDGLIEGTHGEKETRLDEVPSLLKQLKQGFIWREMGDAATTAGFHVLAACIFETGVKWTCGEKGYIWRSLSKSLWKSGRGEAAIKAGYHSIEVESDENKRAQMSGLVRIWEEDGMESNDLYEEEMSMEMESVLEEYVLDGKRGNRQDSNSPKGGGRRRLSSLMVKREDKWKVLTTVGAKTSTDPSKGGKGRGIGNLAQLLRNHEVEPKKKKKKKEGGGEDEGVAIQKIFSGSRRSTLTETIDW